MRPSEIIDKIFFDLVQEEGMNVDMDRLRYTAILKYLDKQEELTTKP